MGKAPKLPHTDYFSANYSFLFFFFFFFGVFRAAPMAYGSSQTGGQIGAGAATYTTVGSEPCLRPTPQLMAIPDP